MAHATTLEGNAGDAGDASKRCQFCGEQILAVAIKCKHCSSALTPGAPAATQVAPTGGDAIGVLLALVPWIGVVLCWFWVGESPLIVASSNLQTLSVGIVLLTAILVAIDASALKLGAKDGPHPSAFGPVGAFIGTLLLWVVIFPVHMSNRGKAGVPSRLAPSLLGAIAFTASAIYVVVLIDERIREIRSSLGGY